ncbi:MAG: glycosyltransferase family 39 protein [Anaerolineae bacterium]
MDGWVRWDAGWYYDIAERGYTNVPRNEQGQRDTAFFPLYPLLVRTMKAIVRDTFLAGLVVSNAGFLVALTLLFRLVSNHYNAEVARRSIILLSVYPFSFYFSAMYSESLFLLAVVCAFYFGERQQWSWAALGAAAAGATRVVGAVTVVGLIVLYLEQIGFDWRKVRSDILWIPLGLLGLGTYMAFLAIRFGDPLQFVKSQYVPGWAAGVGIESALATVRASLAPQSIAAGHYPAMNLIHLSIFLFALLLSVLAWRQPRRAYAVWAILTILASFSLWRSMGRFAAVVFPLFIVASLMLDQDRWYQIVVYVSTLMLALFTVMYAHFYWVS